jgi:uncharacterized membrane protein YgcG
MQTMSVDTTNSTTTIRQRLLEHPSDERPATTDHNRILPRDSPFHQSSGTLNIQRKNTVKSLYNQSWFYTVIHFSTWKIILLMTLLYAVLCVVFAVPYFWISSQCGLDMKTFLDALYFSLETMVTIGYGVPKDDPYLNECGYALPLIFVQSVLGCLYDAVCMGLVFSRMSRVNKRATTILFSDKAIVRFTPHGVPYFMFQVCEMRKHQLIEAHVRCYAFLRPLSTGGGSGSGSGGSGSGGGGSGSGSGSGKRRKFITKTMRLEHPDDELGGLILLAAPQIIAHRIDHWSPLCPPLMSDPLANGPHAFPSLIRRGIDGALGREEPIFPPGEQQAEQNEQKDQGHVSTQRHRRRTVKEKQEYLLQWFEQSRLEVLCLVEGIESVGSGTLQCRHSYAPDDILFDHEFDECVWDEGGATIDFDRFHRVVPIEPTDRYQPWNTCSHIA